VAEWPAPDEARAIGARGAISRECATLRREADAWKRAHPDDAEPGYAEGLYTAASRLERVGWMIAAMAEEGER
jgi:hypothetical protein